MTVSANYTNRDIFIGGQTDVSSKETDEKDDVLGKDAFLTMMVAQLKNQDPLSPMDGTDFTAQLAQFSSLEQQLTTNSNLEAILGELKSSADETNLFNYIGKNITSDGNPVTVHNGDVVSGGEFTLDEPATIDVVVYNADGAAVRVLSSGTELVEKGTYDIEWDGRDASGYKVANGEYTYDVIAKKGDGEYMTVKTDSTGLVTGLTSSGGKVYLVVDGRNVDPASVETVTLPDEAESG